MADDPNALPTVLAGVPATNLWLYHRVRFLVGDPAALITLPDGSTTFILRDIEMDRARKHARADRVACPRDFEPPGGLSGDRETATAQAVAECLRRAGASAVRTDRSLPMIYAHFMGLAGIDVRCDPELGVLERRAKDEQEVTHLRKAQRMTERAMELACGMVAHADASADGTLFVSGELLTADRVRAAVDVFLLEHNFRNDTMIVAGGPQGADCHDRGSGPLMTGQPVIIDIFPQDRTTLYNGDCTRVVVHGDVPDEVAKMHAAVVEAKAAAIDACRAGTTGERVHAVTAEIIRGHGYEMGMPPEGAPDTYCGMVHGTGHGVGVEVHEPPLLDTGGPLLVAGDCLTVEPGLYSLAIGGIRIEDMVIVRDGGPPENLNALPEGLDWRG
jgi:Xaa-Pro aminopeptidase